MKRYNLKFLEKKLGKFYKEYKYPRISINDGFIILYIEKENKADLNIKLKNKRRKQNSSLYLGLHY